MSTIPKAVDQLPVINGQSPKGAFRNGATLSGAPAPVLVDLRKKGDKHSAENDGLLPICKEGNRPFLRHCDFGPSWPVMSIETIKRRIRQRLDDLGINMKRASLDAELGETFVRDVLERDREPSASKLQQLAQSLGVTLAWMAGEVDSVEDPDAAPEDSISVPIRDVRLSAGPGALNDSANEIGTWRFSRRYLTEELRVNPTNLAVVEVQGDSMEPTLRSGDRVLVDHSDTNPAKPGIYALWDSNATVVKRIEMVPYSDPQEVVLISDNKNHNQYRVLADLVNVLGRVVWFARRL